MFEECEPKGFKTDPIPDGQCSIDAGGNLRVRQADLTLVGIEDSVTLLFDSTTMRLGLRRPRPGKKSFKVTRFDCCGHGWAHIRVGSALREMRLETETAKGRHELLTKEDLLIVDLTGLGEEGEASEEEKGATKRK